jgi:phage tail-like protein
MARRRTGSREDPYRGFNFIVVIKGAALAGFNEACLSVEGDIIEDRKGSDAALTARKLPGLRKFGNITLRRGYTIDQDLWQWHRNVLDGMDDRRSGAIEVLDEERNRLTEWRFENGSISKYEGPTLNARGTEVAIESIEIAHEGLQFA